MNEKTKWEAGSIKNLLPILCLVVILGKLDVHHQCYTVYE